MNTIYDGHIHLMPPIKDTPEVFAGKAKSAGIGGGMIIGFPPAESPLYAAADMSAPSNNERIAVLLDYCAKIPGYHPCHWINPTEPDASEQVQYAKEKGIEAIKVICSHHHPSAGLKTYQKCADLNLPILFHSGILWDGEISIDYNRPSAFECLLDVYNLRFALAHVAWPWCDELIALYGKMRQASFTRKDRKLTPYIDLCPGVPDISRMEVFDKIFRLGYGLADKVIFGVDSTVNSYDAKYAKHVYDTDQRIFSELHGKYGVISMPKCEGSFMAAEKSSDINFLKTFENAVSKNLLGFLHGK